MLGDEVRVEEWEGLKSLRVREEEERREGEGMVGEESWRED